MLLIATRNKDKIKEFRRLIPFDFITINDLEEPIDVEETGNSYFENAQLKAKTLSLLTGMPTLADDSGLEVEALNNRPGVFSARYAPTSEKRIEKLLKELDGVVNRNATFKTVLCFSNPKSGGTIFSIGETEGQILHSPKGTNGFGYDPIFFYKKMNCSFAEILDKQKDLISYRSKAIRNILPFIKCVINV